MKQVLLSNRNLFASGVIVSLLTFQTAGFARPRAIVTTGPVQIVSSDLRSGARREADAVRAYAKALSDFASASKSGSPDALSNQARNLKARFAECQRNVQSIIRKAKASGEWNNQLDQNVRSAVAEKSQKMVSFLDNNGGFRKIAEKIAVDQGLLREIDDDASTRGLKKFFRCLLLAANIGFQVIFDPAGVTDAIVKFNEECL